MTDINELIQVVENVNELNILEIIINFNTHRNL